MCSNVNVTADGKKSHSCGKVGKTLSRSKSRRGSEDLGSGGLMSFEEAHWEGEQRWVDMEEEE